MKLTYKSKMATSLALISILTFQPTISFAKEDPISNFFTKMFSSKSSTTEQSTKTQIFKTDISSLSIQNLANFKTSIKDILKNYLSEKEVNNFLKNIVDEEDKNIDANDLDQFDNLLPKSNTDKVKGQALIRIAKKLGKDEKTIFEIKKKIIFQISSVNGIELAVGNITPDTQKIVDTKDKTKNIENSQSSKTWLAGLAGLGLAGGGGSGGSSGGGSSWPSNPTDYETAEYNTQYGLGNINASTAYARGYTGSGITVSVMDNTYDTDHPNLVGVFNTGYNAATGGTDVTCTGTCTSSHGTHVAGIIAGNKNETEMHGVAYNAKIKPIRIADGEWTYDITASQLVTAIGEASGNTITAMNNSWGTKGVSSLTIGATTYYYRRPFIGSLSSVETTAWESAVNNTVVVFSNGNEGLNNSTGQVAYYGSSSDASNRNNRIGYASNATYLNINTPSFYGNLAANNSNLAGKWLTVVALDSNNNIASYSNGCGSAKTFCISAPGSSIYSTVDLDDTSESGNYATYSGTSMAAPHVTAAIAILKQQFPNLTSSQLVSLLISTATDLGDTGVDDVYGSGMLNLSAATVPSGEAFIVANNANRTQATTNNTYIRSSSVFGDSFTRSNLEVGILDAYDRAYLWNPIQENSNNIQLNANNFLNQFQNEKVSRTKIGSNSYFNYKTNDENLVNYDEIKFSYKEDDLTQSINILKNTENYYLDNKNQMSLPKFTYIYSNFYNINQFSNELQLTDEIKILSNVASAKTDESNKIREFSLSTKYTSNNFTSNFSIGNIIEKDNFLGASFAGAYDLSDQTNSSYLSLNSENSITQNIIFNTSYLKMLSKNSFKNSSFANISDVKSDTMKIGFTFKKIFEKSDKINLNYKKPLAVISGSLDQSTIKGYNSDGDYNSVNERYSLVNNARQETISIGYNSNLEENFNFFSTLHLTENWNNKKDNDNYGILAGFKVNF